MKPVKITSGILILSFISLLNIAKAVKTCNPPARFRALQGTHFQICYEIILNMTIDERRDSGCFDGDPEEGVLTTDGCRTMCGCKSEMWEWKDIFNRLSLLVLPTVVLIADLGFPPLGWFMYILLPLQAIGNPIGRFQSLLIRFITQRSHRRRATDIFLNHQGQDELSEHQKLLSRSLATVFSAYDEFGWQDVAEDIKGPFTPEEEQIIIKASYQLSSTRLTSKVPSMIAIATLIGSLITAIVRTIKQLDESEVRVNNETAHTIAVVCILFVTIPQVWLGARIGTFTTDAGAIHILKTMEKELAKVVVQPGQTGREPPLFPSLKLVVCHRRHRIWQWVSVLVPECLANFFSRCPLEEPEELEEPEVSIHSEPQAELPMEQDDSRWRGLSGNFMGINSSWRACNYLPPDSKAPGHFHLLVISYLFAFCGSGLPAFFLSASNNSVGKKIGLGCRSLSWVLIMAFWTLSIGLDSIIRGYVCYSFRDRTPERNRSFRGHTPEAKLKRIWELTIIKDTFITLVVIALVLLVEFGAYNNCVCRSSFSSIVKLLPYTRGEWKRAKLLWSLLPLGGLVANLGGLLWIEFAYWDAEGCFPWVPRFASQGGTLLCKDGKEVEEEWQEAVGGQNDNQDSSRNMVTAEGDFELPEFRSGSQTLERERLLGQGPDVADGG